jgi:uncharacterized membrane protein HdeD (DUF308 family)
MGTVAITVGVLLAVTSVAARRPKARFALFGVLVVGVVLYVVFRLRACTGGGGCTGPEGPGALVVGIILVVGAGIGLVMRWILTRRDRQRRGFM